MSIVIGVIIGVVGSLIAAYLKGPLDGMRDKAVSGWQNRRRQKSERWRQKVELMRISTSWQLVEGVTSILTTISGIAAGFCGAAIHANLLISEVRAPLPLNVKIVLWGIEGMSLVGMVLSLRAAMDSYTALLEAQHSDGGGGPGGTT